MPEVEIGKVSGFFAHPVVAGIELSKKLKVGDTIHIQGHTTDIELTIESMQINNANVSEAKVGDSVGVKVPERVRKSTRRRPCDRSVCIGSAEFLGVRKSSYSIQSLPSSGWENWKLFKDDLVTIR